MQDLLFIGIAYGVPAFILFAIFVYILTLRRIVPTNVVHIVQRGDRTVSYGVGKGSNVYYAFPKWIPKIGVVVRILPVSNFDVELNGYSAYDKDRVPFVVDVKAFFHIADTNKAAEKVESFEELKGQLVNIVQGAVRSILAKSKLEEIMEERSIFGEKFTMSVKEDLKSWGVEPIKNIELMDVRDAKESNVIHQIMAKRMSAIDMESRTEVAKNNKLAKQAELEAQQEVDVKTAETEKIAGEAYAQSEQAVKIAKAVSEREAGIAEQKAKSEIANAEKATAEQVMEVNRINAIRQAEIDRESAIIQTEQQKKQIEIQAEAAKFQVEMEAAANLEAKKKDAAAVQVVGRAEADVIQAKGISEAESVKALQLASVAAQAELAKEIGANKPYQDYLIRVKEVEVSQVVGVAQFEALREGLKEADLKLLVNSGDVQSGIGKLSDVFSSKGASQFNGILEALKQTEEGKAILSLIPGLKND